MDNPDQSALYQAFQESFSKQLVGSSYPEVYNQQPQTQPQVQSNVWPPPAVHPHQAVVQPHNPYPGAELDFPSGNPAAIDAMRGQVPVASQFYGQEFYDMQPQQQPQSMQGYYEASNSLMGMPGQPTSYPASPSPASSWPQQYPPVVPAVPTKMEPPSTPVPGVHEAYFNPTPDPMSPPTNEHFPGKLKFIMINRRSKKAKRT